MEMEADSANARSICQVGKHEEQRKQDDMSTVLNGPAPIFKKVKL